MSYCRIDKNQVTVHETSDCLEFLEQVILIVFQLLVFKYFSMYVPLFCMNPPPQLFSLFLDFLHLWLVQRLIVCLEESLYIHNIRDMKVLHTIRDTPPNPTGICALSSNNDNCYLAYPGSHQTGGIEIFDTVNLVNGLDLIFHLYVIYMIFVLC